MLVSKSSENLKTMLSLAFHVQLRVQQCLGSPPEPTYNWVITMLMRLIKVLPTSHAYARSGSVTGTVVYVNYGQGWGCIGNAKNLESAGSGYACNMKFTLLQSFNSCQSFLPNPQWRTNKNCTRF
ncbi:hypothetical protein V6N12_071982 [Hibiscus sabdariffa]|uniref:Uncharacterized protein n=1 Tax=Hibiscus sabdariffa TaxID=183260 RepID=A0ABR2FLD3_9ROSI